MTVADPVDVAVNPNDPSQRYILWGNGRVDNIGGAPAITEHPDWTGSLDMPVAVALHIADWSTGQGYVLDLFGAFQTLNGATQLGAQGVVPGVPYTIPTRMYVDWSWNPDGSGQGVVLDQYGELHPFGGAPSPPRTGPRWGYPAARRLVMDWTPGAVKAFTLDWYGGIQTDYAAPAASGYGYWPGVDAARDLVVTDWSVPKGYTLDLYGGINPFGGAPIAYGEPYRPGADVGRRLAVLSPADPIRFWAVWSGGQQFEWVASTPPTVTAGAGGSPAASVTTTTRPTLSWAYSDPQKDSQAAWQLYVFTQAFVAGHDMTDPSVWAPSAVVALSGTDTARRGAVPDVDLEDGQYRVYIRAQDTSGLWSVWSNVGWTQAVPAPVAPTGLTATADEDTFTVALSATCTTGGSADMVAFGFSDDSGTTWNLVRGAEAVPLAAITTAVDRDIPCGVERTYRAVTYNDSPRVVSAPSNTVTAVILRYEHLLTSVDDPTLGGVVKVVDAPSWTRTVVAGVFQGAGADYPTVVDDGGPKARKQTLTLETDQAVEFAKVEDLLEAGGALVYRDPFGVVVYCKVVGDWTPTQVRAGASKREVTPFRHLHRMSLPLVEIAQPVVLPVASTVPPGPAGAA